MFSDNLVYLDRSDNQILPIEIVNLKFYKGPHEYMGRPSILGNPYSSKKSKIAKFKTSSVEESIEKFEIWLYSQIEADDELIIGEIERLAKIAQNGNLILGCWCWPFTRCHCEIIKEVIEEFLR